MRLLPRWACLGLRMFALGALRPAAGHAEWQTFDYRNGLGTNPFFSPVDAAPPRTESIS